MGCHISDDLDDSYVCSLVFGLWGKNGQKRAEQAYKGGEKVGKWTTYNEYGSVKEVKEY